MKAAYTELLYYGARFYDPQLGRFISADTIVPQAGNPQDLNRYAYARNNPVIHTDSTGHCIDGVSTVVCITALAAVGGGLVNLGLYMWNTSSSGETIDAGEAALAFGTGALASGALMVGAATGSGTLMLAGLGGMAGSDGYMLGNILTGNEFDAVDYTIATGYGAIGAAAGPEVATTKGAAIAYGATVNLLQYGMTEVAHGRKGTLNGAAWALGSGAVGGFFGGPYPESIPQQAISAISNGWSVAPLGSQLVHQTLMDMPSRQFAGNVAKAFGAGIASNYPPQWPQLFSPTKSIHLSGGSGQPMQMK